MAGMFCGTSPHVAPEGRAADVRTRGLGPWSPIGREQRGSSAVIEFRDAWIGPAR